MALRPFESNVAPLAGFCARFGDPDYLRSYVSMSSVVQFIS